MKEVLMGELSEGKGGYTTFISATIKLFETLLQGFKSRSDTFHPIVTENHFSGWHFIKHLLDMKTEERVNMCELINCHKPLLVKIIQKQTFDTSEVQNIKKIIQEEKHFDKVLLKDFQQYMNQHLYKMSDGRIKTAIFPIITRGLNNKIQELLASQKEDASMQASRIDEEKENAAIDITKPL